MPAAAGSDGRTPERPRHADPVDALIGEALDRLDERRRRSHDPLTGRWTSENGGRLETAHRSALFVRELDAARDAIAGRVIAQLGLTDGDAPEVALRTVEAYSEATLLRRSEFLQLARLPDLPSKNTRRRKALQDRARRHMQAWALAFDRELKAAQLLGLERKARPVDLARALSGLDR